MGLALVTKKKERGLIPAAELSGCKPWHLPRVDSGHVVRSPFAQKQPGARPSSPQAHAHEGSEEDSDVKPLTVEAIEKIREEAHREGFEEGRRDGFSQGQGEGLKAGHDEGYNQGLAKAQSEIDALKAQLAGMIAALEQPLGEQRQELEDTLVTLAKETAEAVVNRELKTRPELLTQAVHEALAALPQSEDRLSFAVNPADEALLKTVRERERAEWDIYPDSDVSQGGFRVKGRHSYLDYTRERRFFDVAEQLLNGEDEESA